MHLFEYASPNEQLCLQKAIKLSDNVKDAVKDVAEKSMADVSKEFRGDNDEKDVISIDGTW